MPNANSLLRQQRQLRGWSQVHLAKQMGVPDYYISRWERGEVLPSPFYQQKLCEIFGKTTQELGIFPPKEDASSNQNEIEQLDDGAIDTQLVDRLSERIFIQSPDLAFHHSLPTLAHPTTPLPDIFTSLPASDATGTETIFARETFTTGALPADPLTPNPITTPPLTSHPTPPVSATPVQPSHPKKFVARRSPLLLLLLAFLIISVALGASLQFIQGHFASSHSSPTLISTSVNDGYLYFTSSGQTSELSNQGIADQVELRLDHVVQPLAGKADYVWLMPDSAQPEAPVTLVGKLLIQNGVGSLHYSDSQHNNLLSTNSRLLVTEEESAVQPLTPSPDKHTWRYSATIPQDQTEDGHTFLDHLRHLLSDEPSVKVRKLSGGLAIWFYRDTRDILEWSNSAREYWQGNNTTNVDFMRRQAIRILEYLDGISNVTVDAPVNKAFPILVDYRKGGIPILQLSQEQNPTGYLYHIGLHLLGLVAFSSASPDLRSRVSRLMKALDAMNGWLKQLRQDARQIAAMTDNQLRQQEALPILNDMATNANYAYVGKEDPATNTTQEGAEWLYNTILQLAKVGVFAVKN